MIHKKQDNKRPLHLLLICLSKAITSVESSSTFITLTHTRSAFLLGQQVIHVQVKFKNETVKLSHMLSDMHVSAINPKKILRLSSSSRHDCFCGFGI